MVAIGIFWAVLAAIASGFFLFTLKLADGMNPFAVSAYVRLAGVVTAVVLVLFFWMKGGVTVGDFSNKLSFYVIAGGIAIALADIFLLKSFSNGTPGYIAITILAGGGMALATLLSILILGEGITLFKLLGIGLVLIGISILSFF